MLFELYDLPVAAQQAQLIFGLALGIIFGAAAQISRFCLRRAVVSSSDQKQALGVWLTGLATAFIGVALAARFGGLDISDHRFFSNDIPVLAILIGAAAFGVGMVLTRGCISRLTVLTATGNLRAATVIIIFGLVAHATLKGVFAPLRVWLGSITVQSDVTSFADLPGGPYLWVAIIVLGLAGAIYHLRPRLRDAGLAAVIGLLAAAGWFGTSVLLMDEFDPLPVQSLAFTLPHADTLFWTIASSALPAGFGVGLVGGVLLGSFASAALRREISLQSFSSPKETLRYTLGGALMGFGGVLAGGCTVGAGLSGVSSLSFAALLTLGTIIAAARATDILFRRVPAGAAA